MGVGAGVRFRDGEDDLALAAGQPGQPFGLLLGAAVGRDHLAADGAGDQQQQQGAALRRGLLADDREFHQAGPAAAVGLRHVQAEVAVLAERLPQLAGELPRLGFAGVVVVAEIGGDRGDRLPQREVFGVGGELH